MVKETDLNFEKCPGVVSNESNVFHGSGLKEDSPSILNISQTSISSRTFAPAILSSSIQISDKFSWPPSSTCRDKDSFLSVFAAQVDKADPNPANETGSSAGSKRECGIYAHLKLEIRSCSPLSRNFRDRASVVIRRRSHTTCASSTPEIINLISCSPVRSTIC